MDLVSTIRLPAYRAVTRIYSQFRFGRYPRPGLRILMYHAIGTPIEDDARGMYNMSFRQFSRQMHFLAECYPDRLVPFGCKISNNDSLSIALTFDDGYRDNLTLAAPLLVELSIPFTVFVCTGAVSGRKAGFLSPEEVRELARFPGVKIGAHSISHPLLTMCDDYSLSQELRGSKSYLEDLLGQEVDALAYPHGAVNRRVRDMAENVGYRVGASSRFDINQPLRDPLLLCRTDIWASDEPSIFEQKLRGDWDWLRWRHMDPAQLV